MPSVVQSVAERLCRTPGRAVIMCVVSSLAFVWAGLAVTYYTKFPVGFLITAFAFAGYLAVRLVPWVPRPARRPGDKRIVCVGHHPAVRRGGQERERSGIAK